MIVAPFVLTTLVRRRGAGGGYESRWPHWREDDAVVCFRITDELAAWDAAGEYFSARRVYASAAAYGYFPGIPKAALSLKEFISHLVPVSIIDAMARNEILQVVVFSIFFGVAAAAVGEKAEPVIRALDAIAHVILKVTGYIMKAAPLAVFGAMAAVIAKQGLGVMKSYSLFIGEFYLGLLLLWGILLGAGYLFGGKPCLKLVPRLKEPLLWPSPPRAARRLIRRR